MHFKGLEMPGYDVRSLKTFAMGLAVGTRGACHNRSLAYELDIKGKVNRFTAEPGRGKMAMDKENFACILDCLVLCKFLRNCFEDFQRRCGAHLYHDHRHPHDGRGADGGGRARLQPEKGVQHPRGLDQGATTGCRRACSRTLFPAGPGKGVLCHARGVAHD